MTCFDPQKLLGVSQAEIRQKCQERVKELEELKTAVDSLKVMMVVGVNKATSEGVKNVCHVDAQRCVQNSAQRAMVESQKMFEDMIRSIDRMRSEVTKLIGINEKAAFNQAEALIERLEQEIDELKKKESGLKQLYSTEDHIHFLQVPKETVGFRHRPRQPTHQRSSSPSELQLPLHPHRRRLHTPSQPQPRLLLRRRQESRGRDQGAPGGVRPGGAGQDLQVRCVSGDGRTKNAGGVRFNKRECGVCCSERDAGVHHREPDVGQKEQR